MELGTNHSQEFLWVEQDMGRPRLLRWVRAPEEGGSSDRPAADYGRSLWRLVGFVHHA